ncbi:MAG: hypothetical protein Q8N16_03445 [bacterium]|nr:hypothetical protein [bacterium]
MLTFFRKIPRKTITEIVVLAVLLFWYGFFLFHKIDLTTADLGRHLKNGELVLENFSFENPVLKTNFYSYTQPEYPVINHHWLSGIAFSLVFKAAGFVGVHWFFIILSFIAFWLFFRLAKKEAGLEVAGILSLLIIPLISERTEIRPEVFSYVFCGVFLNLLWEYRENRLGWKKLLWLPLLEIFWVNLHLYFFLGPLLILIFLIEMMSRLFHGREKDVTRGLPIVFFLTILATLINPFGLQGSLAPLSIFNNYGYRLVENQSIWFLEKLGFVVNPNFLLLKIALSVLLLSFILAAKANWRRISPVNAFMAFGFTVGAVLALRNFTVFALFFLPLVAANLKVIGEKVKFPSEIKLDFFSLPRSFLLAVLGIAIFALSLAAHQSRLSAKPFGLGLFDGNEQSVQFFTSQSLKGPVFNNYDIGGYLIFYLFPKERVFVDNRPEAYSKEFFEKEYIPIQENELRWQTAQSQYGFNAIFFAWHDATPWGQQFLIERVKDKTWAPVYVDDFSIIFLKRNEQNQKIIDKFELPKDYFKVI